MSKVPPFSPTPLRLMYVQVAEHIAARIEAGELEPGTRLPPERDVAAEYGVAYNTVRKSMEILRDRGLIVTMQGRGTFVNERQAPREPNPDGAAPGSEPMSERSGAGVVNWRSCRYLRAWARAGQRMCQ